MSICPRCKQRERNGDQPYCKECTSEYAKAYYKKNRKSILAKNKAYRDNLSGPALVRKKLRDAAYSEKRKSDPKLREELRIYQREWRKKHPDKVKEYNKRATDSRRMRRIKEHKGIEEMKKALAVAAFAM